MAIDFESLTLGPVVTVLGEAITFTPDGGVGESVRGVFEKTYISVNAGGEIITESTQPRVLVKESDLSAFPKNPDQFTIRGVDYSVNEAQKDGEGGLLVSLHEVI